MVKSKAKPRGLEKTVQIAVYTPPALMRKVEQEAVRRRRRLGPTVLEILHEYFNKPTDVQT